VERPFLGKKRRVDHPFWVTSPVSKEKEPFFSNREGKQPLYTTGLEPLSDYQPSPHVSREEDRSPAKNNSLSV